MTTEEIMRLREFITYSLHTLAAQDPNWLLVVYRAVEEGRLIAEN